MKLNKEQIQQIEGYLDKKKIVYIDIRFEVLDHISTDIEYLMGNNDFSFESAFKEVTIKWNKSFKSTSSWFLGLANSGPKLLIDHCLRIYKPTLIKVALFMLASTLLFSTYYKQIQVNFAPFQTIGKYMFSIFSILYISLIFFWKHKINKVGKTTTYHYLYKKAVMPNVIFSTLLILQVILYDKNTFDVSILLFTIIFLLNLHTGFSFYKKHLKVVSNYKKYQLQ